MNQKVLAIIPARYGSVRLPGKPLLEILGKSLIQRTYESTLKCQLVDDVVVATDDQRIFDHVLSFGGKVVMTSLNCQNGTERLVEVLQKEPSYNQYPIILNIQGDLPCIESEIMEKTIEILQSDSDAVMSTAAFKITSKEDAISPSTVKCVMDLQNNALYFSRALIPGHLDGEDQFKEEYYHHIGIYAYLREFLLKYPTLPSTPLQIIENLEQLKVLEHGYRVKIAVVNHTCLSVDIPEDIKKVEQFLCKQNSSL